MKPYEMEWGSNRLELGTRTCIMGILNVTPDSFSDGGKFFRPEEAVAQAEKMVEAGADIIDIGGESTRPFAETVKPEEEIQRVVPVIKTLAQRISVPISIDTTKSTVAEQAINAGASIVNDIGALSIDPGLADVVAEHGVPVILMHMKGTSQNMQVKPQYDDLFSEIKSFLEDAMRIAQQHGIPRSRIIIDPGIGFGKTVAHNLQILKHLSVFETLDRPILIGASRKAFIRTILKTEDGPDLDPSRAIVETGTQAAIAVSIMNGAHIVRVHNVANTLATVKILNALNQQPPTDLGV